MAQPACQKEHQSFTVRKFYHLSRVLDMLMSLTQFPKINFFLTKLIFHNIFFAETVLRVSIETQKQNDEIFLLGRILTSSSLALSIAAQLGDRACWIISGGNHHTSFKYV